MTLDPEGTRLLNLAFNAVQSALILAFWLWQHHKSKGG